MTVPLRSEEHTSELQSRFDVVCRLLLEKKNYVVVTSQPVQHVKVMPIFDAGVQFFAGPSSKGLDAQARGSSQSFGSFLFLFFFNDTATTEIYTLSLHDALPITPIARPSGSRSAEAFRLVGMTSPRSEEHTSELQSRFELVCRLLLEKKKKK